MDDEKTLTAARALVLRAAGSYADSLLRQPADGPGLVWGSQEAREEAQRIRIALAFITSSSVRTLQTLHCTQGCGELHRSEAGAYGCLECGWGMPRNCPACGREPREAYPWWDGDYNCAGCGVPAAAERPGASAQAFRDALDAYAATDGPHLDPGGPPCRECGSEVQGGACTECGRTRVRQ